jgi:hypothetical protein
MTAGHSHFELSAQRCFNHAAREAAARCPSCGRCFCRECVTDHDGKVMCAKCLQRLTSRSGRQPAWLGDLTVGAVAAVAAIFGWYCFYLVGSLLLRLPSSFHDGTVWTQ